MHGLATAMNQGHDPGDGAGIDMGLHGGGQPLQPLTGKPAPVPAMPLPLNFVD